MTSAFAVPSQRPAARISALALLLVGAALIVVGILQTTTSRLTGVGCPEGTALVAKFEFNGTSYVFEKPAGNENVVTITNGSAEGGDAHSTIPIDVVVIKGGNASNIVTFTPAQTNLHFSNVGLPPVGNGNTPDISNVQFCRNVTPPPDTTPPTEPETTPPTQPETTPPTQPETTPPTQPETTPPHAPATTQPAASTTTTSVEQEPVVVSTSTTIVTGSTTSLPHTGAPSAALIALGAVLMASGGSLMVIGRARDRRANS